MKAAKCLMIEDESFPSTAKNRFYSKVRLPSREDGCMEWAGSLINKDGYGGFHAINGKYMSTHRYSYILHHGEIPKNICVLHKCDNPICVRPDHLFLGTQVENIIDRISKGRTAKGVSKIASKLDDEKVREIRNLIEKGLPLIDIAKTFNVSDTTVYNIKINKIWKHVK